MKTKILLFLSFLFFIFSESANAQIENEIKSYSDSTVEFVNNGRKLILQSIEKEDYEKTKEIYQYLTEITEGKAYSAFYYFESLNILLITSDWSSFLEKAKNYNLYKNKIPYPDSYEIGYMLRQNISAKSESILDNSKKDNYQ